MIHRKVLDGAQSYLFMKPKPKIQRRAVGGLRKTDQKLMAKYTHLGPSFGHPASLLGCMSIFMDQRITIWVCFGLCISRVRMNPYHTQSQVDFD